MLIATGAWGFHVLAMAMAPLSMVQAVISGGLVFLTVLAERFFGFNIGRRQWVGVGLTALGLALLAVTLPHSGGAHSNYSLAGMIARIARWAAKEIGLRWVDRFLGGAFGLVRGVVIVTVAVMAFAAFSPNSPALARSQLSGYFLLAARTGSWVAFSELRAKVRDGVFAIRNMNPELASQHDRKPSAAQAAETSSQNDQKKLALSEPDLPADSNRKTNGSPSSQRVNK